MPLVTNQIETLNGVPFATDMTMTEASSGKSSRLVMSELQVDAARQGEGHHQRRGGQVARPDVRVHAPFKISVA